MRSQKTKLITKPTGRGAAGGSPAPYPLTRRETETRSKVRDEGYSKQDEFGNQNTTQPKAPHHPSTPPTSPACPLAGNGLWRAAASPAALIRYLLLSFTWAPRGGRAGQGEGAEAGRGVLNGNSGRRRAPPPGLRLCRRVECLRQAPERDRNKSVEVGQKVRLRCPWPVKVRW